MEVLIIIGLVLVAMFVAALITVKAKKAKETNAQGGRGWKREEDNGRDEIRKDEDVN